MQRRTDGVNTKCWSSFSLIKQSQHEKENWSIGWFQLQYCSVLSGAEVFHCFTPTQTNLLLFIFFKKLENESTLLRAALCIEHFDWLLNAIGNSNDTLSSTHINKSHNKNGIRRFLRIGCLQSSPRPFEMIWILHRCFRTNASITEDKTWRRIFKFL